MGLIGINPPCFYIIPQPWGGCLIKKSLYVRYGLRDGYTCSQVPKAWLLLDKRGSE